MVMGTFQRLKVILILILSLFIAEASLASAAQCSDLFTQIRVTRYLRDLPRLRLMTYNLENFYIEPGGSKVQLKSPEKVQGVAEVVLDQRPDILIVQEVQSQSALETFNRDFLKERYETYLIEGNDGRGINVGFLVKKDLAVSVELQSHKDFKWIDPVKNVEEVIFSRDLPALIIRETESSRPSLVIFGNHGKSKRDRPGDPESLKLRTAQIEAIAYITQAYKQRFGEDTPIVVAGDFNTNVGNGPELRPLRADFVDAFDVSPTERNGLDRSTHTFHPRGKQVQAHEMDAFFLNEMLVDAVKSARVYRYRDRNGIEKPLPETYDLRAENPSDHFPVVVDIALDPLLQVNP